MFTQNSRSAQGDSDSPCRQCCGTGVVFPGWLYPKEAAVACSCKTGDALFSRILEIMNRPEEEANEERVDEPAEQEQQSSIRSKGYVETLDMLQFLKMWRPKKMSKLTSTCVVSLPARDVEADISQEPSEPGRVLGFAKADVPAKSEGREKASNDLTRSQKIRRIVESAIDKMDDDQLEALVIAVEEITGCHSGGDSE